MVDVSSLPTAIAEGDPLHDEGHQLIHAVLKLINAGGDLLVGSGADAIDRLAVGAAGKRLRVNAAGTGLEWASIGMASYKTAVGEVNAALPSGASWQEWRTAARLTQAAAVGDRIVCSGSAFLDNAANTYYFDWAIVNPSTNAIIRRFGGAYGQGFASGGAYQSPGLSADFTIASGDIVGGNVTIAQVWYGSGARNLLLFDYMYGIRALNIGP